MRRLSTFIKFDEYRKSFENCEINSSQWYSLLKSALEEIENDTLEVMIFFLDSRLCMYMFHPYNHANKKFENSQILVIKEYIKRVLTTEEVTRKKQEEFHKREAEAKQHLDKLRQEELKKLMQDPYFTGIKPISLEEFKEKMRGKNG